MQFLAFLFLLRHNISGSLHIELSANFERALQVALFAQIGRMREPTDNDIEELLEFWLHQVVARGGHRVKFQAVFLEEL